MTQTIAQSYLAEAVLTASPQRLVVMMYDRLVLDLDRAHAALARTDHGGAHDALVHAQDIVIELRGALDVEIWPAGKALAAVYDYVLRLLVDANVRKTPRPVVEARELMVPLRDTWREIAGVGAAAV
jgi:flagellar protein FliS